MLRYRVSLVVAALAMGGALHPQDTPSIAQEVLNQIAMPLAETSFQPPLPHTYAAWTEQQRSVVPAQITGRCNVAWVMMNAGGQIQLLPPALDGQTRELLAEVCLAGKMPADWPDRASTIQKAGTLLRRSTALGHPLSLPERLRL